MITDKPKTYLTKTGKILTDADIERLADDTESRYDAEELKSRGAVAVGHRSPAGGGAG